jgi:RNA polymerase sigma-70 factor, ECF subfamily
VTYAPRYVNFVGRTNAAAISKPLPAFRAKKRNVRSTSSKSPSYEAHNVLEARAEVIGKEAFEEMFVTSRPRFVRMAYAILRNREDAEDAVQNAFLSGHRHLRSFEGRSALKTWFTRIVLNAALMIKRKRKPSRITPLSENNSHEVDWTESIPTSQPDPEMAYAENETNQLINKVLEKMKPALRGAFTMTYYDELSCREACALLGVSTGTFKARVFRARRQLLNQMQRALKAAIRKRARSAFFPNKNAIQSLFARPSDTSPLETSCL